MFVHPDGRRASGRIAVGQPYTLDGGEAECPIEIGGLHERLHPIIGDGTLQALLLGVRFAGSRLNDFVSRGGRVVDPEDGSDIDLTVLFAPQFAR